MMMRANARVLPRGSSAQSDPSGALRCDRAAEDMLRSFWSEAADGAALPVELRGLSEGAQTGAPGVRREGLPAGEQATRKDVLLDEVGTAAVAREKIVADDDRLKTGAGAAPPHESNPEGKRPDAGGPGTPPGAESS